MEARGRALATTVKNGEGGVRPRGSRLDGLEEHAYVVASANGRRGLREVDDRFRSHTVTLRRQDLLDER